MPDNLEVIVARIDERTEHMEKDIAEVKKNVGKLFDTVNEHGQQLASIKTEIGNNHGLSKKQTAGIGGAAGFIAAVFVAVVDYFMRLRS